MKAITIVEIDLPFCSLDYGSSPCTASIGVTGDRKCFNVRGTCQDLLNFTPAPLTLRFIAPSAILTYDAIPSIQGISIRPAVIDPGRSLGERESVTVTFTDHPSSDAGLDKYLGDRSYNPVEQGSFWGKFKARNISLKGQALRILRGEEGDALSAMTTYNYVIESMSGPSKERFTITAKDPLKLADGDRAQAPALSTGELAATIAAGVTTATLSPTGIGDLEYPASGKVAIGGKEICDFTRAGDVMTLGRGQSNTEDVSHEEGERMQLVLQYTAERVSDILYDLFTTYSNIDASYIPLSEWQSEVDSFIGRLYTAEIARPTSVRKLADELIEQVGLIMWSDIIAEQIRLSALRPVSSTADIYTPDRIVSGSYGAKDQPKKRISQSWTFYGLLNPLANLTDEENYGYAVALIDPDGTEADHDEQPAIKKVFSRWINAGNQTAASRLNSLLLARYQSAPRSFSFAVWENDVHPALGRGALLQHWELQDDQGAEITVPVQMTSISVGADKVAAEAEEMLFSDSFDLGGRVVIIEQDEFDINLREKYDAIYTAPGSYDTVTFIVSAGVEIGTFWVNAGIASTNRFAITVGDWPENPTVRLVNNGTIVGGGAAGKDARIGGGVGGGPGAHAIYTRYPIAIENNGLIGGGGGGGGRGTSHGGGGGAGARQYPNAYGDPYAPGGPNSDWPGNPNSHGESGMLETGGAGGGASGGAGGDLGMPGSAGTGGPGSTIDGGAAGNAIDGDSFVTLDLEGDIRGARIN